MDSTAFNILRCQEKNKYAHALHGCIHFGKSLSKKKITLASEHRSYQIGQEMIGMVLFPVAYRFSSRNR